MYWILSHVSELVFKIEWLFSYLAWRPLYVAFLNNGYFGYYYEHTQISDWA